jgi:hypothetical protein
MFLFLTASHNHSISALILFTQLTEIVSQSIGNQSRTFREYNLSRTMMKEQRSRVMSSILLTALFLVATLLCTAESFSPFPKTVGRSQLQTPPTTSSPFLQETSFPRDTIVGKVSRSGMDEKQSKLPSWVNLPNRETARQAVKTTLFETEISVGRLAMVGAVGLILQELVTGESILEQLSDMVIW